MQCPPPDTQDPAEEGGIFSGLLDDPIRNIVAFLHRLCGMDLQAHLPWTLETLLERYRKLNVSCRSLITLHAHAHWINLLLRCPDVGMQNGFSSPSRSKKNPSARFGSASPARLCTPALLQPLLATRGGVVPTTNRHHPLLVRHSFSREEVVRLHDAARSDPMDHLLLLLHTRWVRALSLSHRAAFSPPPFASVA